MTDNELLLAISDMIDKKLEPIKRDLQDIKLSLNKNLNNSYKYEIESMYEDIRLLKKVVLEHSEKLKNIS